MCVVSDGRWLCVETSNERIQARVEREWKNTDTNEEDKRQRWRGIGGRPAHARRPHSNASKQIVPELVPFWSQEMQVRTLLPL